MLDADTNRTDLELRLIRRSLSFRKLSHSIDPTACVGAFLAGGGLLTVQSARFDLAQGFRSTGAFAPRQKNHFDDGILEEPVLAHVSYLSHADVFPRGGAVLPHSGRIRRLMLTAWLRGTVSRFATGSSDLKGDVP